jgi:hypothetical protein
MLKRIVQISFNGQGVHSSVSLQKGAVILIYEPETIHSFIQISIEGKKIVISTNLMYINTTPQPIGAG